MFSRIGDIFTILHDSFEDEEKDDEEQGELVFVAVVDVSPIILLIENLHFGLILSKLNIRVKFSQTNLQFSILFKNFNLK